MERFVETEFGNFKRIFQTPFKELVLDCLSLEIWENLGVSKGNVSEFKTFLLMSGKLFGWLSSGIDLFDLHFKFKLLFI